MPNFACELDLVCHPDAADRDVESIGVALERGADGALRLTYRLRGRLTGLRLPAAELPARRLWAQTCCELFVRPADGRAYREFNFSPNGQWMRFDFADYRQEREPPAPAPLGAPPGIVCACDAGAMRVTVQLDASQLPPGDLLVALSVVCEHADGGHTYWALRHPPGRPDFHHREGFALHLKAPAP